MRGSQYSKTFQSKGHALHAQVTILEAHLHDKTSRTGIRFLSSYHMCSKKCV
jgi:hypothetical protein